MHEKTIAQLSEMLANKQVSSVELAQHFLQRIKKYDSKLNSFITIIEEQAITAAKQADQHLQAGKATKLTGIPIAQKDIFCTKGVKTSCGSKMLDNFISPYDATIIEKFSAAGMVMLGKTNMDEFAMGSSNENSFYGPVKNPWDLTTVPGGSSGGSAAAVAARLAPAATGTDTGGSIRQPAALCGITGLKPTYGLVSRFGMIAFASSLDQGGPMAASAEDCALLLTAMAGFDEKDSTSVQYQVPNYQAHLTDDIKGLRIGMPKEFFNKNLDNHIAALIDAAILQLKKLGATVHEISIPNIELAIPVYYIVAPAECSSNLARYDGVRYGYRCDNPKNLEDLYKRTRSEAFGREVKRRILIGTYALSHGYYDALYVKALKIRKLIADGFQQAFSQVDVIATPTTPSPAFTIGAKTKDPLEMYLNDIYTIPVNLAGLPGISIPIGFQNKLPIGMQFIANHFEETRLLNTAHRYQMETDWHLRVPDGFKV